MIETERLRLLALTMNQLAQCQPNPPQIEPPLAPGLINEPVRGAVKMKLSKMARTPTVLHVWLTYWLMIVKADEIGVGMVGFKGIINHEGEVEIGYGIVSAYEGQGYTTEAVRALLDWAFTYPDCLSVRAVTDKTNIGSQRVLKKVGMEMDRERERDLIWLIRRTA